VVGHQHATEVPFHVDAPAGGRRRADALERRRRATRDLRCRAGGLTGASQLLSANAGGVSEPSSPT